MKLEVHSSKRPTAERLQAVRYNELTTNTRDTSEPYTSAKDDSQYQHCQAQHLTNNHNFDTKTWRVKKLFEGAEQRMAEHCCIQSMLTLLHVCMGLASGFYAVFAVVGEGYSLQCLPPLVDHFGDTVPFMHGLPTLCYGVLYGMIGVCVLSFLMAICINCCWENSCAIFTNLSFTVITAAVSVFGGAAFTVHYMLWCDSLSQTLARPHLRCEEAAKSFDNSHNSSNMTLYHTKLEIQQISLWVILPFAMVAIVTYASAIYIAAVRDTKGQSLRGYVILQDETTPLLTTRTEPSTSQQMRNPCSPPDYSGTSPAVVQIHDDPDVNYNGSRMSPTPSAPSMRRSPYHDQSNPFTTSRST